MSDRFIVARAYTPPQYPPMPGAYQVPKTISAKQGTVRPVQIGILIGMNARANV